MLVALSNIIYNACGFDPRRNHTLREQGMRVAQAQQVASGIRGEYGLHLTVDQILDKSPEQLSEYVSK